MPEHALRTPDAPARSRFSRILGARRRGTDRSCHSSSTAPSTTAESRSARAVRSVGRRSRLAIAGCAVAGVATLGACSPGQIPAGAHAVNIAYGYLGVPYVYGGSSPAGFDCSGLTGYVYAQLGKQLPRSAEAQFEAVQKIPQSWAQKGDLIFFGSPGAIYHVGIYVGNGVIEHAPTPGQVVQFTRIWTSAYYVGRVA